MGVCRGSVFAFHPLQLEMSANGMSALEELRRSTERQIWAPSSRDLGWPEAEWQFPGNRKRKRTFDEQSQSAKFDPSLHIAAMRNLVATGA